MGSTPIIGFFKLSFFSDFQISARAAHGQTIRAHAQIWADLGMPMGTKPIQIDRRWSLIHNQMQTTQTSTLESYVSFDRLLPSKTYFTKQSAIQMIAVANQVNYWRSLGNTSFQQKCEGSPPSYEDKIYDLGELSSRSFFTRSYFKVNTRVVLKDAITFWRRLPHISSIRVAIKHAVVQNADVIEVAACVNFKQLCSPYHSSFALPHSTRAFLKLTWSIDSCLDHLETNYESYLDFQDPTAQPPLIFEQGQAASQFRFNQPRQLPEEPVVHLPPSVSTHELQKEVKVDQLRDILTSFANDNFALFATKLNALAIKYGIKATTNALSEAQKLMEE